MPFVAEAMGETALGLRERKKQRTRATLIDAAVTLCGRQGFDRTTVEQIAALAEVSPRTFSRYFATKDAIAMAMVDEILDRVAIELTGLPAELNPLDALLRAHIGVGLAAKAGAPGAIAVDRVMCVMGILLSSPTLRQSALHYRHAAIGAALGRRMGTDPGDRRLQLVTSVWSAVVMTALAELAAENENWSDVTIEDLIARIESVYADFTALAPWAREVV